MKWNTATESCMRKGAIHHLNPHIYPEAFFIFTRKKSTCFLFTFGQSCWITFWIFSLLLLASFATSFFLNLFFLFLQKSSFNPHFFFSSQWEKWICYNIQISQAWHFIKHVICNACLPFKYFIFLLIFILVLWDNTWQADEVE